MYESIISKQKLISLEEETHTYKLKNSNINFVSVTKFISTFFSEFDEYKVATKLTHLEKYKGQNVASILKDWENKRNRGTIVHKEIENFIIELNKDYTNYKTKFVNNLDLKSQQGINFLKSCNIYKNNLIFPEVKVYSEELQLAGTIDLLIYNSRESFKMS